MFELFLSELSMSTEQYMSVFATNAPKYVSALALFLLFWLFSSLQRHISGIISGKIDSASTKTISILVGRVTRFIILGIGIVVAFSILGVDWDALITGLGLVGFGVSFALKDSIENFIAGVIILTQHPFRIGDQVKIKEIHGKVEEIATRYTVIKDFDGNQVILSNSDMLSSSITIDNAYGRKRYSVNIDIDVNTDVVFALKGGINLVRKTVGVLTKPKPRAVVSSIEDGKVMLRYYFWAHPREEFELSVRSHLHKNLLHLFDKNHIELGFQTSRVVSSTKKMVKKHSPLKQEQGDESDSPEYEHQDDPGIAD